MDKLDKIFRSNDVRGIYGVDFDETDFYRMGFAFAKFLKASSIAIGRDVRLSSETLASAFSQGAFEAGAEIVNLGIIPTEMIYHITCQDNQFDGAAMITASHNPPEDNGCKMVGRGGKAISKTYGLNEIRDILQSTKRSQYIQSSVLGKVEKKYFNSYKEKVTEPLKFIVPSRAVKIVVDAGNGVSGLYLEKIFEGYPIEITKLYFEPDGLFPNHLPDPSQSENIKQLINIVKETGADIGIGFDGDADRACFVDRKGRNPSGIYTSAIIAPILLENTKDEKVLHGPQSIYPLIDSIKKYNGIPVMQKVGHSAYKELMRVENAIFGADRSSHFFYRDYYGCDSSMYTVSIVLAAIFGGLDFTAEMDRIYKQFPYSGEINYRAENPDKIVFELERIFAKDSVNINKIDGLSVDYNDWRFNIRTSNTENVVRLNIESLSTSKLILAYSQLESILKNKASRLNEPDNPDLVGIVIQ